MPFSWVPIPPLPFTIVFPGSRAGLKASELFESKNSPLYPFQKDPWRQASSTPDYYPGFFRVYLESRLPPVNNTHEKGLRDESSKSGVQESMKLDAMGTKLRTSYGMQILRNQMHITRLSNPVC